MRSTHLRNVAAMQAAPKCQAITKAGLRCKKPALKGGPLCKSHSYEPVRPVPRAVRSADQRRAYVELQQAIWRDVREIEKDIRWAKVNEIPHYLIDRLSARRASLSELADRDGSTKRNTPSPRILAASA